MPGMSRTTGQAIDGLAGLNQSLVDILTTPIGSRVMRRDYGSRLFELIDAPINRSTIVDLYAATAEAIAQWEPRFALTRVQLEQATRGAVSLSLSGRYRPNGQPITLDGVRVAP